MTVENYDEMRQNAMLYGRELSLLRDTLSKLHIRVLLLSENDAPEVFHEAATSFAMPPPPEKDGIRRFFAGLSEKTVYRTKDRFGQSFRYFLLPAQKARTLLIVGPFLSRRLTAEEILEIGERHAVPPQSQRFLNEYYASLTVLPEESPVFVLLDTFCERIFERPSFAVEDGSGDDASLGLSPDGATHDPSLDMKAVERRYAFENELINAVRQGQLHKEKQLFSLLSEEQFEKRIPDRLRNAKNYAVIMNTLLRKAAEEGGVHPVIIDSVSSDFAREIEHLSDLSKGRDLMREIFSSYCRLVRKNLSGIRSHIVRDAAVLVNARLSEELSTAKIAKMLGVSAGYLSSVFRKEIGKTLSAYIREKRMKNAAHLLKTTHLQVQTVALHSGFLDMQYFSKLFKKETGATPKEYREMHQLSEKHVEM